MILASHGIIASSILQVDADWLAYYNRVIAAGGSLTTTEQNATKTLVADLKANGLWTPMKAIYPMVGASAAACAQNLKSSSFTGTFSSGWTFASTGVTPNGTSATFNTGLNPTTALSSVNSNHQAVYLRTLNQAVQSVDIGQDNPNWLSAIRFSGNQIFIYNPTAALGTISGGFNNSNNLSINTRRSSTDFVFFNNNSKIATNTTLNAGAFVSGNVHLASAGGTSLFSARENAFASIGDGLTDTQASNFYTAVQAFQTTLSRQV